MTESVSSTEIEGLPSTEVGDVTILTPPAALTYTNCRSVGAACKRLLQSAKPRVVLDCKAVALMDSETLETLLETHHLLEDHGGSLRIIHLNEVCSDIFVATRLLNVLHVYPDLARALKGG